MPSSSTNYSFAKALFEIGIEEKNLDTFTDYSTKLLDAIYSDDNVFSFILNYNIDISEKEKLLNTIFKEKNNFYSKWILVIITQKKAKYLREILNKFINMSNDYKGITIGTILTTERLSESKIREFEKFVLQKEKVMFKNKIDKTIIGGIKIQIKDKIWDRTIKTRIELLAKNAITKD